MLICQISTVITPEKSKKYVTGVCSFVVLLTLIGPIIDIGKNIPDIEGYLSDMLSVDYSYNGESEYRSAANMIFAYAEDKFAIKRDDIKVTFITDDNGMTKEIQIFLKNSPYSAREEIRKVVEEEFGVKTFIFEDEVQNGNIEAEKIIAEK